MAPDNDQKTTAFNGFVFQHPTRTNWSFNLESPDPAKPEQSLPSLADQDFSSPKNHGHESAAATGNDIATVEVGDPHDNASFLAASLNEMHIDSSRLSGRDNSALFTYHSQSEKQLQAIRRKRALELQRKIRDGKINQYRHRQVGIPDRESDSEEEDDDSQEQELGYMPRIGETLKRRRDDDDDGADGTKLACFDTPPPKPKNIGKSLWGKNKKPEKQIQLMYGETLVDVPSDWATNWVFIPYPKGKRCMVKAGNGRSVSYNKFGHALNRFQSMLPNGSKSDGKQFSQDYCVLDCVYDAVHWTYYVLDMLCWKGYSIDDFDTSFRQYWLKTHMTAEEMDLPTSENMFHKFKIAHPIPSDDIKEMLLNPESYLQKRGDTYQIDGIMLYHQQLFYTAGETPLVSWVPLSDFSSLASAL